MRTLIFPLAILSFISAYMQVSPGPFPLVSDNVLVTSVVFLFCLLPFLSLLYGVFVGGDWIVKRYPHNLIKTAITLVGLALAIVVVFSALLFGKLSGVDKEFLRHPSNDEVRYGDEAQTSNGRIYFWVLHDEGALGYSGIGGFYEKKIAPGLFWRKMLCSKFKNGEFGIRLLDDRHVECNVLGTKATYELF